MVHTTFRAAAIAFGFFRGRRDIDYGVNAGRTDGLLKYANVPPVIGTIVSAGKATLHELQTVYGVEDVYDMLEVVTVDLHNERVIRGRRDSN